MIRHALTGQTVLTINSEVDLLPSELEVAYFAVAVRVHVSCESVLIAREGTWQLRPKNEDYFHGTLVVLGILMKI